MPSEDCIGRQQKTSQNPTLVAQQSISNFILVMLSRVKSPWFIYILFYQHDSGLCSVCAQTYLILLEMAMIIIMNDNKDDNADLMRVLCAHTFSWWWWTALCLGFTKHLSQHKCCTQYMAHRAHTGTMYKGCTFQKHFTHHMFAQCAHSRQMRIALRCTQLHCIESKKIIFTQFIWSRFHSRQTHWVLFISLNNFDKTIVSQ